MSKDNLSEIDHGRVLTCRTCGYELCHLRSERCPECGQPFDRALAVLSADDQMRQRTARLDGALLTTAVFTMCGPLLVGLCPPLGILALVVAGLYVSGILVEEVWLALFPTRDLTAKAAAPYLIQEHGRTLRKALLAFYGALIAGSALVFLVPQRELGFWLAAWLSVSAMALLALVLLRRRTVARRMAQGLCVNCGYNLRGNVTGICPECGRSTTDSVVGSGGT